MDYNRYLDVHCSTKSAIRSLRPPKEGMSGKIKDFLQQFEAQMFQGILKL